MRCPECQAELPDTAKFCNECGTKIEIVCPQCGNLNPSGSKFCLECGLGLVTPASSGVPKDLSFDEKLSKIQRYLPKGLTEKILAQRDRIEGERKHVTVMFCDMVGFTPLVEKLGPEDAYALMDQVQEILIHKVHEYEGTVNQLTGDGLMALFGAPIALEDAPQRAIRSSLAIHREMNRFSEKIREEGGFPTIKMRIGINTGPVVVGTVGNDLRVEFAAVGDTVNTASRMEGLAEPGTTYVTENTFNLTEGFFRFEGLGYKHIKGKEEPMKVYRVIAPSTRRTRFDVSTERGLTRFVGRERELEIMLDAFERAKGGRGQAVSIVGEAGVGKSRLLYEFRKAVVNEDRTFLEGKCLSYSRGMAYHPIIDVLKSNFEIQEENGDREIREKVKRGLQLLDAEESTTLPYLLEILSVKDSGIDKIPMSAEARKERISEAVKRIVLKGSAMRPLILAFEDLHWMDKSSEDLSKQILESIPGARVLLIFTYRPEFVHTWGAKSYHSQLSLSRLSNRETLTMVTDILKAARIDPNVEDLILEKTEGIPFFIEEFVRSLRDLGIISVTDNHFFLATETRGTTIPSTIQEVIMARVDSLPDPAKELLQTGSVIEREFSYRLIKAVSNLPEQELLSHLSALKDAELLYERGIYPECTYIFKHALTREVVYDSMLAMRRNELHQQIASQMEDLHRDNLDENFAILAHHFVAACNYCKGAEYCELTGKKAARTGSLKDAIEHATRRVACLEKLPQTDEVQKTIIEARTVLGLYYSQFNCHFEAKEAVDPIIHLATKHASKRRLSQIYSIMGSHAYWVQEDVPQALGYLEDALRLSEEVGDVVSMTMANWWLGMAHSFQCEFDKANRFMAKALSINLEAKNLWATAICKGGIAYLVRYHQGQVGLANEMSSEAVGMASESDDIYSKSLLYLYRGICCYGMRYLDEASKYLIKGRDSSERISYALVNQMSTLYLAELYYETGQYDKARDCYQDVIDLVERSRVLPSTSRLARIGLASAKLMNKDGNIDLEPLYVCVSGNILPWYEGLIRLHLSEILLNIDDHHISEAQHWIESAIEADERNSMRFHLARDCALYAEFFKREGETFNAKEQLGKAIEIYKECGADGWVTKAEEELEKLQ